MSSGESSTTVLASSSIGSTATASGSVASTTENGTTTETLYYAYDANGVPMFLTYTAPDGTTTTYYYATNIQGDVTAILDTTGTPVVEYTYDAWGNPLTTTGTLASTLGALNSLRYRGCVYDAETEFYYVSSRYYNPAIGRWLNTDALLGQGRALGNNTFIYCLNDPINMADTTGNLPFLVITAVVGTVVGAVVGGVKAAKNGGNVWKGIGIGATAGGLTGLGFGAAGGFLLAGSATASTAAVASGAGMFTTAVSTGGLGSGVALIADNTSRAMSSAGTVLYSGGAQAAQKATEFASQTGGVMIDNTQIGEIATVASKLPQADFTTVWSQASAAFCNQASGTVNAFVASSAYRGVDSIFWSVEMPTLLNNSRVTEIVIHIFE